MATDSLSYSGINRAVSDYSGLHVCEELINLRPTESGLAPVNTFSVKMANKPFHKLFVHHTTSGDKYIAIWKDGSTVKVSLVDDSGTVVGDPLFTTAYIDDNSLSSINYATAGNIILISMCDKVNGVYDNKAWTWKDGSYVAMDADVPDVDYEIDDGTDIESATQSIPPLDKDSEGPEIISAIENGINAVLENNTRLCVGPFIIAVAYKTKDGKTFWTNNWKIYDPLEKIGTTSPPYMTSSDLNQTYTAPLYTDFFANYGGFGYVMNDGHTDSNGWLGKIGKSLDEIRVFGTNVSLSFPAVTGWDENTSIIQSVEVYCSKPIPYLDTASAADGFKYGVWMQEQNDYFFNIILAQRKYEDMDLGGQLLYHQASIPMASLAAGTQTVNLSFGGNVQVTEDTLDTDAGAVKRYGKVLSYNARFHYYDSVSKIKIGMPSFNYASRAGTTPVKPDIFVRYADEDQSGLVYLGKYPEYEPMGQHGAYFVIAPSINIKEVIEYFQISGMYFARSYRMTPSTSYNFSYCMDGEDIIPAPSATPMEELEDAKLNTDDIISNEEADVINVSEQYNPFVFLVEHSYKAPGNVIDVQPQMAGVVDSNYGRDPLNVFTERGLYALTQGSANVLYGTFLPISQLVIGSGDGSAISTESGIFFLADGALWLVSGRRSTLVSDALSLGPHKYVRACTGYKKLSGTDTNFSPDPAPSNPFYDVSPYLSQVEFKDFCRGGRLSYNRFRMELFVANPDYGYTYILSLKYRQWFKVSQCLWQDDPGSVIVNRFGTVLGTISIMDMSTELSISTIPLLVHMQSRPFSMGYRYIHMHRIVAMVRSKLASAANKLAVALYGSDDLQNWKLLAYAKRSGKTEYDEQSEELVDTPLFLSQIRTAPSSRSWRYYTVCIGGEILVDYEFPTDFGPFLVDYEPVVRRIG